MTTHLSAILLNTSGYKYPRAYFVRYRGGERSSREYQMTPRRWDTLRTHAVPFLPSLGIGWFGWVRP